jgi:uncharacterized protein involved in copper resistance
MKTSLLLASLLAAAAVLPAVAQDQPRPTEAQIKAEGKADQERIKASTKIDKALTKEAQANVEADAKADKKKLKAHQKAQKQVNDAVADVKKADTKAEVRAAEKK